MKHYYDVWHKPRNSKLYKHFATYDSFNSFHEVLAFLGVKPRKVSYFYDVGEGIEFNYQETSYSISHCNEAR